MTLRPLAIRALLLIALTAGGLLLHSSESGPNAIGPPVQTHIFFVVLAVAALVYLETVRFVVASRQPRQAIWLVLGVAIGLRAALVTSPFMLSSDIYRYVWDGRVQAAGINPYRYIPTDPALEALRDAEIYPSINRKTYARTIYPPAAQVVFAAVGRVSQTVLAMKLAMLAFDLLAIACLIPLMRRAGLPAERVLIYAWNPLVNWSFACDGHVDAIAAGLLALALLLRARRRDGWAGAVLAGAVLVKFLPVVVAPAFVRGGRFWRMALAGLAVIVGLYALYISAGAHVLGFLPSYGEEEGVTSGLGIWLLAGLGGLLPLPSAATPIYFAGVAAGMALLAFAIVRRGKASGAEDVVLLCRDAGVLAACAMVALSPHYAWYFAWLAVPAAVAPLPAVVWLSAASVVLHEDPLNSRFLWPCIVYVPAIVLAAAALWRRSRALLHRAVPSQGVSP